MENNPIASGATSWSRSPSPSFGSSREDILSACMIVGEPNPLVGGVHDRMPVMVLSEDYDQWLGPTSESDELRALLRPYDATLMEAYAVSRAVKSVKNDNEECIEPIGEPRFDPISGAS